MNAKVLVAGVAIAMLTAGASSAKTPSDATSGGNYAAPPAPMPYSELDAYTASKPPANHMAKKHRHKTMDMKAKESADTTAPAAGSMAPTTPPN